MSEREPEEQENPDGQPEDDGSSTVIAPEDEAVEVSGDTVQADEAQDAPKDEEEEDDTLDPEALREEVKELRDRARDAGLHPFRRMLRDYIDNAIDAADSLLGALEGNRKKGK